MTPFKPEPVETRIRHVVWLVLSGAACGTPAPPPRDPPPSIDSAPPSRSPEPMPSASASAAPTPSERAPALPVASAPPPPRSRNPEAVCADYARQSTADPKKVASATRAENNRPVPRELLEATRTTNGVDCFVVRKRTATTMQETITPVCCSPRTPCPGPHQETVRAERTLVEHVLLHDDSTVVSSKLEWVTWNPSPRGQPVCGRRPEGVELTANEAAASTGDILASMAELEAASVLAFDRLARELTLHGAPQELIGDALQARSDEVRHARVVTALARRFGGRLRPAPACVELPCRELLAVARENAIEGCVAETYGALVMTFQAERAGLPELRRAFERIARDERSHAELAARVHDWACSALSGSDRAEIVEARAGATHILFEALRDEPWLAAGLPLGLPSRDEALALCVSYFGAPSRPERAQAAP